MLQQLIVILLNSLILIRLVILKKMDSNTKPSRSITCLKFYGFMIVKHLLLR